MSSGRTCHQQKKKKKKEISNSCLTSSKFKGFPRFQRPAFTQVTKMEKKRLKGRNGTASSPTHSMLANPCPQRKRLIQSMDGDAKWMGTDLLQVYVYHHTDKFTTRHTQHGMLLLLLLFKIHFQLSSAWVTSHEEGKEHCACQSDVTDKCLSVVLSYSSLHTVHLVSFRTNTRSKWWRII